MRNVREAPSQVLGISAQLQTMLELPPLFALDALFAYVATFAMRRRGFGPAARRHHWGKKEMHSSIQRQTGPQKRVISPDLLEMGRIFGRKRTFAGVSSWRESPACQEEEPLISKVHHQMQAALSLGRSLAVVNLRVIGRLFDIRYRRSRSSGAINAARWLTSRWLEANLSKANGRGRLPACGLHTHRRRKAHEGEDGFLSTIPMARGVDL